MGNFDRRGKRSGGGFGGRKSFDRRGGGRPTMHDAVCSDCGNDCQVPFRPTGNKPVLCNDCFGGQDSRGGRDRGRDRGERRDRHERPRYDKQMYDVVCDKCGKDCQVPFKPTTDKPIYCDGCFGKGDSKGKGGSSETSKQIKELSDKLDKLIEMLSVDSSKKETKEPKAEKKEKTEKKPKAEKKEKAEKKAPAKKKK